MFRIKAAHPKNAISERCGDLHRRRSTVPPSLHHGPFAEAFGGGAVGEDMQTNGLTVHNKGILCIDSGTGTLRVAPCRRCGEVLTPPRKGLALLWSNLVDGTLLLLVEVNADTVVLSALEDIAPVEGLASIPFQPSLHVETGVMRQALSIVR